MRYPFARERLLTARFKAFRLKDFGHGQFRDPSVGFIYKKSPRIDSKVIANNTNLDPILDKHDRILATALDRANLALTDVTPELRKALKGKLVEKENLEGKQSVTDADTRRWQLPEKAWKEWEVPYDIDDDWPTALKQSVSAYRVAWRAKIDEVEACISVNATPDELVDEPETIPGVVQVTGPFTVEGVTSLTNCASCTR